MWVLTAIAYLLHWFGFLNSLFFLVFKNEFQIETRLSQTETMSMHRLFRNLSNRVATVKALYRTGHKRADRLDNRKKKKQIVGISMNMVKQFYTNQMLISF